MNIRLNVTFFLLFLWRAKKGKRVGLFEFGLLFLYSGICKYRHRGQPRYGFWHPASKLFIVWRPAEEGYESEFKTCFYVRSGMAYMRGLENVEILRLPRE